MKSFADRLIWLLGLLALMLSVIFVGGCTLLNKAPIIDSLEAEEDSLGATESCEVRVFAYDPDGDQLSYEWSASGGSISGQGEVASWTAPASPDTYTIGVKVTDGRGGETEIQLSLRVIPNSPPVIEDLSAQRTKANRAEAIIIECLAADADGDSLTYTWSATGGNIYGTDSVTAWLAPVELGSYNISVVATDGRGGEASAELTIDVMTNNPPVIVSLMPTEWVILVDNSTDITCMASDSDGDTLSYTWSAPEGKISGGGSTVTWTAAGECGAYVTISVAVFDDRGGETTKELDIQVRKPG